MLSNSCAYANVERDDSAGSLHERAVTSLGPLGIRAGLAGVKVAPRFLAMPTWLPFVYRLCKDQPATLASFWELSPFAAFLLLPLFFSPL